ncbi:laccase domain-containing protein [Bacillus velezensis]|nr:laccase domain-containing protein [Bacillus velezensis]
MRNGKGQYQLDLKEVNRLLLIHCGIPEENISVSGICTERERELFFHTAATKGKRDA